MLSDKNLNIIMNPSNIQARLAHIEADKKRKEEQKKQAIRARIATMTIEQMRDRLHVIEAKITNNDIEARRLYAAMDALNEIEYPTNTEKLKSGKVFQRLHAVTAENVDLAAESRELTCAYIRALHEALASDEAASSTDN